MQLGYLRISKADGSQVLDLQRDALLAAGVEAEQLYHDLASGKRDDRPGLAACLKALRKGQGSRMSVVGDNLEHIGVVPGGPLAPAAQASSTAAVPGDKVEGDL